MKRIFLLLFLGATATVHPLPAAPLCPATGRVVDSAGRAVEYATVVLLQEGRQAAGAATDADGHFELRAAPGDYTLRVQYVGFEPDERPVRVERQTDLGQIVLRPAATHIEGVTVTARPIRREADRLIIDVAQLPTAPGRDGAELLERAPGVWLDNGRISINGKSGTKVYINDRELRMEPEQLLVYLQSLRAEEIRTIEIVPTAGADHDADASGGIIRITLRRRRENGLDGSVSLKTSQSRHTSRYEPGANLNAHTGRVDLYAATGGFFNREVARSNERTSYAAADRELLAHSTLRSRNRNGGARIGAVVEAARDHSLGVEVEYGRDRQWGPTATRTDFRTAQSVVGTESRYDALDRRIKFAATFNYIWKIDTLGSTLKLLADHTRRTTEGSNDNRTRTVGSPEEPDSIYGDRASSTYRITSATLALEKRLSPRWALKAGAKYTHNDTHNEAHYGYLRSEVWHLNEAQSFDLDYTERIAAAYAIGSFEAGRWSFTAGLRAEYTRTRGKGHDVDRDYVSLFPHARLSWTMARSQGHLLTLQYARTIERPSFWSLNPQRDPISDYTYQTGNPLLDPAFKHDISLTLTAAHKYTLTGGMQITTDEIQQTIRPDPADADLLQLTWVNFDATRSYYLAANLPFQPTRWWQINADATYMRRGQRVEQHGREEFFDWVFVNLSTVFTLPARFQIDLAYRYQSRIELSNCWVEPDHRLQATLKKRFGERFTATFTVQNLLDQGQRIGARGEGFVRKVEVAQYWSNRSYRIGLTWNFRAGKAVSRKSIEAASAEEQSRF